MESITERIKMSKIFLSNWLVQKQERTHFEFKIMNIKGSSHFKLFMQVYFDIKFYFSHLSHVDEI